MRLALIGPARGDVSTFARMAEVVLTGAQSTRAIYLGDDDALNDAVALWAQALVGPDPSDDGLWDRALGVVQQGDAEGVAALVRSERARLRLKSIEGVPLEGQRVVEMFGDQIALLVHDRASLDEDDVFSASLLIYGKSDGPLARRIGTRWFLTPGPIAETGGGAIVLDDSEGELKAIFYDLRGQPVRTEILTPSRDGRVGVQE